MEKVPYKAIVGCIMCVMITTKLNIVITIGILNQFVQDPRYVHLRAIKWIMKYLQGMHDYQLQFTRMGKDDEMTFTTYYDSNQGENFDKRKLTIGYINFFWDNVIVSLEQ